MQSRALEPFFPGFSYVRLFGAYSEPNPFINEAAKLIRGNKENWKEEALDNPQLYGMSPDTYQLFLN